MSSDLPLETLEVRGAVVFPSIAAPSLAHYGKVAPAEKERNFGIESGERRNVEEIETGKAGEKEHTDCITSGFLAAFRAEEKQI